MEFSDHATYKSEESIRLEMISYSVGQIGQLLEHNGQLQ